MLNFQSSDPKCRAAHWDAGHKPVQCYSMAMSRRAELFAELGGRAAVGLYLEEALDRVLSGDGPDEGEEKPLTQLVCLNRTLAERGDRTAALWYVHAQAVVTAGTAAHMKDATEEEKQAWERVAEETGSPDVLALVLNELWGAMGQYEDLVKERRPGLEVVVHTVTIFSLTVLEETEEAVAYVRAKLPGAEALLVSGQGRETEMYGVACSAADRT